MSVVVKKKSLVDVKFIFFNKFSLGTFFKFKNCLNNNMKSHGVYGLNCINCTASYIVVTALVLPARVQEHRDAFRGVRYSATAKHAVQTGHNINWNNAKILASDLKELNLFYAESLLILNKKQV